MIQIINILESPKAAKGALVFTLVFVPFCLATFIFFLYLPFAVLGSWCIPIYQVLPLEGNSMAPTINEGDWYIAVKAPKKESIKPGMIIWVRKNDNTYVVHRLIEITPEGYLVTKGDNNQDVDRWFDEEGREYQICQADWVVLGKLHPIFQISQYLNPSGDSRAE